MPKSCIVVTRFDRHLMVASEGEEITGTIGGDPGEKIPAGAKPGSKYDYALDEYYDDFFFDDGYFGY